MNVRKVVNAKFANQMLRVAAYIYLFAGYIVLIYNFSYEIRIASKPVGLMILILYTFGCCVIYDLFNHLLIKKIIPSKILIVIEVMLIITLAILYFSNEFLTT